VDKFIRFLFPTKYYSYEKTISFLGLKALSGKDCNNFFLGDLLVWLEYRLLKALLSKAFRRLAVKCTLEAGLRGIYYIKLIIHLGKKFFSVISA